MVTKNNVKLFGFKTCPFVQRVFITLIEKKIDYEFIVIDPQNRPDWLKQVSPNGGVPVIQHGDAFLYESTVINEYLEEVFSNPPLMPADPLLRAQIRIWISYIDNSFYKNCYYKLLQSQNQSERVELRDKLTECLHFIEQGLLKLSPTGSYWLGEQLSLLDIALYPFFERFPFLEKARAVKIPENCHRLKKWISVMEKRPSIIKTSTDLDTYLQLYAKYLDK